MRARRGEVGDIDISALAAQPWFIPDSTSLLDQLLAFRERREHFAVVVDEYGALMGIVTLEDNLEEIVGEIDDEHEAVVGGVRPKVDGRYIVDGWVTDGQGVGWGKSVSVRVVLVGGGKIKKKKIKK